MTNDSIKAKEPGAVDASITSQGQTPVLGVPLLDLAVLIARRTALIQEMLALASMKRGIASFEVEQRKQAAELDRRIRAAIAAEKAGVGGGGAPLMAINVGQLVVDMRADTATLVGDLGKAERAMGRTAGRMDLSLKGLQTGVGSLGRAFSALGISIAAISIGTVVAKFRELIDTAGGLGELAQQLGITTDTLQSLQYAAVQAGIEASELESSLSILTRTIGDAAAGQESAISAFDRAGVTFQTYGGNARKTEEVLRDVAERIRLASTEAERASLVQDLLGRSGQKLIPILMAGADGFDQMARAAQDAGVVTSSEGIAKSDLLSDSLVRLEYRLEKLGTSIAINFIDPINEVAGALDDLWSNPVFQFLYRMSPGEQMREGLGNMVDIAGGFSDWYNTTPPNLALLYGEENPIGARPDQIGTVPPGMPPSVVSASLAGGADVGDSTVAEYERRAQTLRRVIDALQLEAENLGRSAEEQRLYNELASAGVDIKSQEGQQIAVLVHQIEQRAAAEQELQELLAAELTLMEEGKTLAESLFTPQEVYAAQLARLAELKAANAISDETMARAMERYSEALDETIGKVDKLEEGTTELEDKTKEYAEALGLVAAGAMDWRDLMMRAVGDVIDKIYELIEAAASTKSSSGGILGALINGVGSLLGGGSSFAPGVGPGGMGFLSFGGPRAEGGPVSAGRTYMVGERGPELFTAAASGRILPNDRLGEMGSAPGVVINGLDMRGASVEAVARLEMMVARLHGSIENRAVAATQDARTRGGRYGAAFRR